MTPDPRWAAARHILAVRLDNLGDVLMTTPALAALRHGCPDARLTLLGSGAAAGLAPHLPMVDEVIPYAAPWVQGPAGSPDADRRFIDALGRREFDAAVVFTVCTQSALPAATLCRLAGIPLRLAHCRENPYQLLTDWVRDTETVEDGMRHEVARQLDLVGTLGFHAPDDRLVFQRHAADDASAPRRLARAGGDARRGWVVVHVGATAASRRYPPARFGAAADAIAAASGLQIVFVGSASEQALVDEARAAMRGPSVSLCGQLSLGELAALVAGAEVFVGNNSGPAHLAAAVGTPVVVLYALTNPQHTPWRVTSAVLNHDVPCRNCLKSTCPQGHHACLLEVAPQAVADAALRLAGTRVADAA